MADEVPLSASKPPGYGGEHAMQEEDDRDRIGPPAHRAWITYAIALALALTFVWQLYKADWKLAPFSVNPMVGPSVTDLIRAGAQISDCILEEGQSWRLLTSQFLHAGVVHLAANAYGLISIGPDLERCFGWWRIGLLYFLSGLFAALSSAMFVPTLVCVGASGAICGLYGACWADALVNCSSMKGYRCKSFCGLIFGTIMLLVVSLVPFVNFFAHFGGLVCGFLGGTGLVIRSQYRMDYTHGLWRKRGASCWQVVFGLMGVIAMGVLLVVQAVVLYSVIDPYQYCGWCKNLQCFKTPLWDCDSGGVSCRPYYDPNTNCVVEVECMDGSKFPVQGCIPVSDVQAIGQACKNMCPVFCG